MDASTFAKGELRAADRAHRHRAAGLAVDAQGRGEALGTPGTAGIKHVTPLRLALEIHEVQRALRIHRGLGLQGSGWRTLETHFRAKHGTGLRAGQPDNRKHQRGLHGRGAERKRLPETTVE